MNSVGLYPPTKISFSINLIQLHLKPMNPADRRVVHQLASEHGIVSESAGEGRDRHIVLSV